MREVEQSTTIVVEHRDDGRAIGFQQWTGPRVRSVQRNTVHTGVRDEWIDRVVQMCDIITERAVPMRTEASRIVLQQFATELPNPTSPTEQAVLRAMLVNVSFRWAEADHRAYHTEFPDAECIEDPLAAAMTVWHEATADPKSTFGQWTITFLAAMARVHPRYRARELQRELDATFAQPLSVTKLARQHGVSVKCLQRDFHELTGRTIQEYVRERRLDTAVRMLKDTSDKVEWIANVVGWSSRKNLNRALARSLGTSPSTLRNGTGTKHRGRGGAGTLLLAACLLSALSACSRQPDFDVIIRGGTVYDGTGEASGVRIADVGIGGDRIRAVGDLSGRTAGLEIDAKGKAVAPGFIDAQSRSGVTLLADGEGDSHLRQGITSEVLADDSPALWTTATAHTSTLERYGVTFDWTGLSGYFDKLESRGSAINVGTLIPLSLIPAGADPTALIDTAMRDGALGIVDDIHAPPDQLNAAATTAARNDGITMVRADNALTGSDESIVALGTQARRLVVSDITHGAVPVAGVIVRIATALTRKADVVATVTPYPLNRNEQDTAIRDALKFGGTIIATDSSAMKESGDGEAVVPAAFGAFPRLLAMTREAGGMELREAVRRATSAPARVYALQRRGLVREDYYADLVVFDPLTVSDRATLDNPKQYPVGIDYVIVNGVVELTPKGVTGSRAGTRLVHASPRR